MPPPAIIYEVRLDDLDRRQEGREWISPSLRPAFADGICPAPLPPTSPTRAGQTMRPPPKPGPPRESLVFLLKRRERSRVAAERIGGGWIPGFSLPRIFLFFFFFLSFAKGLCGLARNSRRLPYPLSPRQSTTRWSSCALARARAP